MPDANQKRLQALLAEYERLRLRGELSAAEARRMELLQDVLLELGALAAAEPGRPVRGPRVDAVLAVSVTSDQRLLQAVSRNIGTGGIALTLPRPLPHGASVELRVAFGEERPGEVIRGTVVWCAGNEAGVAFSDLPPSIEARLRGLLRSSDSVLTRVKTVLNTDLRTLGRATAPEPLAASEVEADERPVIAVGLADHGLRSVLSEVLAQAGLRAAAPGDQSGRPAVVVTDVQHALEARAAAPRTPMVMVNVSGEEALTGRLAQLRVAAFVKRPASAATIADAVLRLLSQT